MLTPVLDLFVNQEAQDIRLKRFVLKVREQAIGLLSSGLIDKSALRPIAEQEDGYLGQQLGREQRNNQFFIIKIQ